MSVDKELAALRTLTVNDLRERYACIFGEATRCRNKTWLLRRIAWRLQAQAEGGLSERAQRRADELANEADLRLRPPKKRRAHARTSSEKSSGNTRTTNIGLPPPGTVLTRPYKGQTLEVHVRSDGFEFEGAVHRTLSALAKVITGSHINGRAFFGLGERK